MRNPSKLRFALIRYNSKTYESGGVIAVFTGRARAETAIQQVKIAQSLEDLHGAWSYFLEPTTLRAGIDPEKATTLRQMLLDVRESRALSRLSQLGSDLL